MATLALIWHYVQLVAPYLAVSFIPSLITGLSLFPKTQGAVAVLQKILGFLSFLTHVDSAGTFKAPLTPTQPPAQ